MSELKDIVYSHPHGWAPIAEIEKLLESDGVIIAPLERDSMADGEYHKQFKKEDNVFELHANQWDAKTFQPLIDWVVSKEESLDELAEGLARHFGEQRVRVCGCMGLSCQDLGCALWWRFFLTQHTAEEIYEMVSNYKKRGPKPSRN